MLRRRRPSRTAAIPFAAIIPGSVVLLVITALIVFSIVLSGIINTMPENNFSASIQFGSDIPTEGLLNPDSEVRGVWIASVENINFPSKPGLSRAELQAELDALVSEVKSLNLNAIYFQVRPCSDALYDSALFPTSAYLTGNQSKASPEGFDPLAYLLNAAHSQNIAVHAWVNPLRVTTGTAEAPEQDPEN